MIHEPPKDSDTGFDADFFDQIGEGDPVHEIMLQQAAKLADLGYFVFNMATMTVELCSERHASIFGRTPAEFIGHASGLRGELTMMHSDDADMVRAGYDRLRQGERIELEYRFFRKDGTLGYIREFVAPQQDHSGNVIRGLGSSIDVTQARIEEIRKSHENRLSALGEMTAGVAHDVNNILAVVMGNAELMQLAEPGGVLSDYCDEIVKAAQRGGQLTRRLLNFSQLATIEPVITDLNDEVGIALEVFDRTGLKQAELLDERCHDELTIHVDKNELQAVLFNLMVNARDALDRAGKIVATTRVAAASDIAQVEEVLDPLRGYAMVEIADNGRGVPSDLLHRITEPFFTTKSRAEGSGLGLSMATGFARQSGGALTVASREGLGTQVRVFFPLAGGEG